MSDLSVMLNRPAPLIRPVETTRVACDGLPDAPALGHPKVWLSIAPGHDFIDCPYCDTRFVLVAGAGQGH